MKVVCKVDWGQFEFNKKYNYFYQNKTNKYYVTGEYGNTEFNKRQFDIMFKPEKNTK